MNSLIQTNYKKFSIVALALAFAIVMFGIAIPAFAVGSPDGCTADNSVVNIGKSVSSAEPGETITFTVSASNPTSVDGCDITDRTLTLTLPDGSNVVSGPANYPNGTALSVIISQNYVADPGDLVLGSWTATVNWDGTQEDGFNSPSTGSKNASVVLEPVSLQVVKTAVESFDRTHTWTIDKSVDVAVHDLLTGENGTSNYDVLVTKTTEDSNYAVSGTITITNPAQFATAVVTSVTDSITGIGPVTVTCPGDPGPYNILPGDNLVCSYTSALPNGDTRTNTATVATSGDVSGGSDDESVDFTGVEPTVIGFDTINVNDNVEGPLGSTNDTHTFEYDRVFTCDADEGDHPNIATIVETDQNDNALVTVNCTTPQPLVIEKTADTSFDREWNWTINKVGDQTDLTLAPGQLFTVNYDVTVNAGAPADTNHVVSGTVTITNPAGNPDVNVTSVADALDISGAVTLNCDKGTPVVLSANESINCTYSHSVANKNDTENEVTVVADGGLGGSDTATVSWGSPDGLIDECIDVSDTFPELAAAYPDLTVCVGEDTLPKTFNYSHDVGPYADTACGTSQQVDNTASFVANDTGAQGSDGHTVDVEIACTCTLTQGYWKTHSTDGPAAHPDATWMLLPGGLGQNTVFFLSGQTWLQVFKTAPKGNAYYNLAHQYMAAKLNILSGASAPASVASAITQAETLFNTYSPAQFNALGKKHADRSLAISLAGTLGSYNEGSIGPGHCDEQNPI